MRRRSLARTIRRMHKNPMRPWTVTQLAQSSALSRSAFFERFNRIVGVVQLAERVTYSSRSTFSVVFTRHVGLPPSRYAMQPPPAGGA